MDRYLILPLRADDAGYRQPPPKPVPEPKEEGQGRRATDGRTAAKRMTRRAGYRTEARRDVA